MVLVDEREGQVQRAGHARSIAVGALLLAPTAGLVVVALTLVAHGIWDIWHLRRHRDLVSPSLAEACVALDVPLGLAVLVAVLV